VAHIRVRKNRPPRSRVIQRAAHASATAIQHVGVDDRRLDVLVSEQFQHGPDVVAVVQKVRREAVPKADRNERRVAPIAERVYRSGDQLLPRSMGSADQKSMPARCAAMMALSTRLTSPPAGKWASKRAVLMPCRVALCLVVQRFQIDRMPEPPAGLRRLLLN
jgi:hypothetical protein